MSTNKNHGLSGKVFTFPAVLAMTAGSLAMPVYAFNLDTGNPDLEIRLDTTPKYTAGWRMEGRDSRIAGSPNSDEGDYKFDKGDMVMNRLDILSEFDFVYKGQYGGRVSAAGWYDHAYSDTDVEQSPSLAAQGWQSSYFGDKYSGSTRRYSEGPSGEFLDAFLFANLTLGDTPLNVKVGQHTIYWGSATFDFFGQGINYGQAPQDLRKAASIPGITAKEIFIPVNQISFQSQVAPTLSLAAQYFLDWKPTRFSEGGTFFSGTDFLFDGPDQFPLAPGFSVPREDALEPDDKHGSYGLSASWTPAFMEGGALSAYYRQFDDPTPWLAPQILINGGAPSEYRLVYPEDIKLFGVGANYNILGASVGLDVSYRKNAPLVAAGVSLADNEGPRGDTLHALLNSVKVLEQTPFYDTGTLIAELSYSHLMSVTEHKELFRGEGYGGCPTGSKDDGCATQNFWGVGFQFTPQWLQAFPGVDLSLPITTSYGISGNGATSLSGSEGSYTYSVGLLADFYQKYKVQLTYADSHSDINDVVDGVAVSGNGAYTTNDRGWLSLSLQTSF
ncbi:DUF1302 domain-containing protein [Pseudomonas sp. BF-R-19]|uniref:DUF1302 domain-containing protein n=1 Tax=Pseudomonas sp. BF-R-19 TaxID=2832397 RepID=UPI001CC153F2|nr:DUF1302 domain-containing protein [Pseudomonas sp. BF-R-19]